jgi:hypothetical protein
MYILTERETDHKLAGSTAHTGPLGLVPCGRRPLVIIVFNALRCGGPAVRMIHQTPDAGPPWLQNIFTKATAGARLTLHFVSDRCYARMARRLVRGPSSHLLQAAFCRLMAVSTSRVGHWSPLVRARPPAWPASTQQANASGLRTTGPRPA